MRTRLGKAIRIPARGSLSLLLAGTVTLLQGCDSSGAVSTSTAGAPGSGGVTGGGGTPAETGGQPATGGQSVTPPASGGQPATGGQSTAPPASGGQSTTPPASGGSTGRGGGGSVVGGTTFVGGATSTGGVPPAGGSPPTGGDTKPIVPGSGHFQMENLDRGVVAVKVSGGVYVGWRMFGYEYTGTDSDTSYILYKDGAKLATVTDSTNYLDAAGTASSKYSVSAVIKGTEGKQSDAVTPWAQQYTSIPLKPPASQYNANDAAPGDLDGDGKLDIVLKWEGSTKDNSQSGMTDPVYIAAYTLDGKQLWMLNLGVNIRSGAHYTQMSVGDFDGDGKAEFSCKTAPGTKDGTGAYLSTGVAAGADNTKDYRNTSGYILTGPEWLTVFAGDTGKELATVDYPVQRGNVGDWGDTYGNRLDRYNGGMAWVKDGGVATGRPSIIQQRGYYSRLTISAYTWRDAVLAKNWIYDSVTAVPLGGGDHSLMAADTDGDFGQELITGARTIDSAGTLKCSTDLGHGDAMHISELVVGKGISVYTVHESLGGADCHDGATCKTYFNITGGGDNGRGVADYVGVGNETAASCSSSHTGNLNCGTGATVTPNAGSDFLIYWDADEWREIENGTSISKASGGTLLNASGCASNNGTKNTPTLTADLLGDWREELVLRETSNTNLRVYTTTEVTKRRIYTLMHDPTYRAQVAFENASYNQPPHPGFHIGVGMANPPVPDIYVK
jgi:rhamnogalacturonan endolyase